MSSHYDLSHTPLDPEMRERMRRVMDYFGWKNRGLARRLNCSHMAVSNWLSGKYRMPMTFANWLCEMDAFIDAHPMPNCGLVEVIRVAKERRSEPKPPKPVVVARPKVKAVRVKMLPRSVFPPFLGEETWRG